MVKNILVRVAQAMSGINVKSTLLIAKDIKNVSAFKMGGQKVQRLWQNI